MNHETIVRETGGEFVAFPILGLNSRGLFQQIEDFAVFY